MALFATHPPIEERIRALQAGASGSDLAGATMAAPLKYKIEIEARTASGATCAVRTARS